MSSTNPDNNLTPAEIDSLNQLEAVAQDGLDTFVEVGEALAEIRDRRLYRDTHSSFVAYVRERWGVDVATGDPLSETDIPADARVMTTSAAVTNKPCEALAKACEQTLSALSDEDRAGIEVRVAIRKPGDPVGHKDGQSWDPWEVSEALAEEPLPTLRWLLTQASGTIGRVALELERRAADIDDGAREQLRDDVLVIDEEIATLKALLVGHVDWDTEFEHLLKGEFPPFDADRDPEDDE